MSDKSIPECTCNFGFVETGFGNGDRNIITVFYPDGHVMYSNRDMGESVDDLDLHCVRCGKPKVWDWGIVGDLSK